MTSLYLHLPFCERKCFYCSFAVAISQEQRMDEYVGALAQEASRYQGTKIKTIYLGGGTPAMLSTTALISLFKNLRQQFQWPMDCEITVEANPENLNIEKAKLLLNLGVTRISLGVQTFHDDYLKYLGRVHDAMKALTAFNDLRRVGFKNINVDLMYSFPQQTSADIVADVKTVLGLGSEHVSLYTLTVEENSRFYTQKIREQDRHAQGEQFELVATLLEEAGLKQYEVSNFCRPGFASQHNINYWQGGNYIGLGMSSHSHFDGRRSWNVSRLMEYLKKVQAQEDPQEGFEVLPPEKQLRETLVFGLRMNQGVDLAWLEKKYQLIIPNEVREKIVLCIQEGLLVREGNQLKTTMRGRRVLDQISVDLI